MGYLIMFSTFENEWNKIENLYNNYCYNEKDIPSR